MKVFVINMFLIFLISYTAIAQDGPYDFETESPIMMSMTPLIDKSKLETEQNITDLRFISNDEYNISIVSHAIKNFSYGIAYRLEDGLPVERSMTFFRDLSFFDINWNYEIKNFNFSVSVSNILNFRDSVLELEPYLERQSLVAEEIYFSHEATSNIQASIQYRF